MKEINYPQLSSLSEEGLVRVIEQGSGGAFPALISAASLIAESGSDSNGMYVRLADGTQICTHVLSSVTTSTAEGSVYTAAVTWTFPKEFVDTNYSLSGSTTPGSGLTWVARADSPTTTAVGVRLGGSSNTASGTPRVHAIGRWY